MAPLDRFTVVLDACTIFAMLPRDVLTWHNWSNYACQHEEPRDIHWAYFPLLRALL
jgi:hypothetical protein